MKRQRCATSELKTELLRSDDSLVRMFARQYKLQKRLHLGVDPAGFPEKEKVNYLVHRLTALIMEGAEALDHLPWKHWKTYQEPTPEELQELKYELIDVFHFLLNVFMATGGTPAEFVAIFEDKNKQNHARQDGGY